jgi:hypothetical protein
MREQVMITNKYNGAKGEQFIEPERAREAGGTTANAVLRRYLRVSASECAQTWNEGIPHEHRYCRQCQDVLGDEFHFCVECPALAPERTGAFNYIRDQISAIKDGRRLWEWFNSLTNYKKTFALLGKLPETTSLALLEAWYQAAAKGLNRMYQLKKRLDRQLNGNADARR